MLWVREVAPLLCLFAVALSASAQDQTGPACNSFLAKNPRAACVGDDSKENQQIRRQLMTAAEFKTYACALKELLPPAALSAEVATTQHEGLRSSSDSSAMQYRSLAAKFMTLSELCRRLARECESSCANAPETTTCTEISEATTSNFSLAKHYNDRAKESAVASDRSSASTP